MEKRHTHLCPPCSQSASCACVDSAWFVGLGRCLLANKLLTWLAIKKHAMVWQASRVRQRNVGCLSHPQTPASSAVRPAKGLKVAKLRLMGFTATCPLPSPHPDCPKVHASRAPARHQPLVMAFIISQPVSGQLAVYPDLTEVQEVRYDT